MMGVMHSLEETDLGAQMTGHGILESTSLHGGKREMADMASARSWALESLRGSLVERDPRGRGRREGP
jgi:hypothetical protein